MKIGLLAYHSAINFGATLQLLSTYRFLTNKGHEPVVINWVPKDLEKMYSRLASSAQAELHRRLRKELWRETRLCRTTQDVADVIQEEGIEAVIAGSDSILQHHTLLERIVFPSRRIVSIKKTTSDRTFPNPFWGTFNELLPKPVPFAVLSASTQDSVYKYYPKRLRRRMAEALGKCCYMSFRDAWAEFGFREILGTKERLRQTPDPVFAFLQNAADLLPSREDILRRFGLPEKYFVMSFLDDRSVSQEWLDEFASLAGEKGIACVSLPFSHKPSFGRMEYSVELPLSPIDWFSLIRFSQGYIGNNMHPVVVALHTCVPVFSFDTYGFPRLGGRRLDDESSKTFDILCMADLDYCRHSVVNPRPWSYKVSYAMELLTNFEFDKEREFAEEYYQDYLQMMDDILKAISKG